MAETTGILLGGLVLGSDDPERLSAWYRAAFAPSAEPGTVLMVGGSRLVFDRRDDLGRSAREPGRILVNFYVEDIAAAVERLKGLGAAWIRPVEEFGPGLIATVEDPVGNYVQVVEFAARPGGGAEAGDGREADGGRQAGEGGPSRADERRGAGR